jgi:2-methylisocitrate lyase-like PEP mutase family enzyme
LSALPPGRRRNRRAAGFWCLHEGLGILLLAIAWSNLPNSRAVQAVCPAVTCLVNILMGPASLDWSMAELQAADVRRVSLGHALTRIAEDAWTAAARAGPHTGRFAYRRAIVELSAG